MTPEQPNIGDQAGQLIETLRNAIRLHKIRSINTIPRPQDKELWQHLNDPE